MEPYSVPSLQKLCRKKIKLSIPVEEAKEYELETGLEDSFDSNHSDSEDEEVEAEIEASRILNNDSSSDWKVIETYQNSFIQSISSQRFNHIWHLEQLGDTNELSIFEQFFSKYLREFIANETNRYFKQMKDISTEKSRLSNFYPVTENEILKFIGTLVVMGLYPRKHMEGSVIIYPF